MQLAFKTTKNLGDHKRHLTGNKPNLSVLYLHGQNRYTK